MAQTANKRKAFEREALPHLNGVYRYALRLSGDPFRAEDLVQETMVKAYRSWHRYDNGTNIRAWLFTILRNTLISQYRKRRNQVENVDLAEVDGFTVFELMQQPDPGESYFHELVAEEVVQAIDSLPDDYREVVVLVDVEELSYEEVAGVIGVPIGTVKSRLHRARRTLQRALCDYALEMGYIQPDHSCCADAA